MTTTKKKLLLPSTMAQAGRAVLREAQRRRGDLLRCKHARVPRAARRGGRRRAEPHAVRRSGGQLRLTPLDLIERLAALIRPPRLHRQRSHGMLAPLHPSNDSYQAMTVYWSMTGVGRSAPL